MIDICLGHLVIAYISVQLQGHTKTLTDQCFVKDSVHRLKLSATSWRLKKAHGANLTAGSWPHGKLDKGKNRVNRRLCSELGCPFCDSIVSEMSDLYTTNIYPPNIPRLVYLRVKASRCQSFCSTCQTQLKVNCWTVFFVYCFFNKMFIKSRVSLSIALSIRRVDRTGRTVSLRPAAAPASLPPLAACYFPARWLSSPRAESSLSAFLNGAPTPPHTYLSE